MNIDSSDPAFRLATDFVRNTSQHLFLTGKAGTGKTTFLKYIAQNSGKQTLVAAPTGVAAINAGGVTLHSLFQLPLEPYIPNSRLKDTFKFGKHKIDLVQKTELLIIDEVSMLRSDMLDAVDSTLRFLRRNSKPFGGLQMLYIGDLFQLPPVVKESEWALLRNYYESPFFFHAKALQKVAPLYLELKTIYRQREQLFVDILNRVRNNEMTETDREMLNARYHRNFSSPDGSRYITLCTHNQQADRINALKLSEINSELHVFSGEITGEFPDHALPTDRQLQLKVGAQIMFIKNDSGEYRRYYNGKIAEIVDIDGDDIFVLPEGGNEAFKIEQETWKNMRYSINKEKNEIEETEIGSYRQYPVRLAWAITVHKSQGLTFDRVVIDVGQAFAAGQAYVALSRCTSLEGIVLLSPVTGDCVMTDANAVDFSHNEKPVNELEKTLASARLRYWAERLSRYFDWKPLIFMLSEHCRFTEEHTSAELKHAHELSKQLLRTAVQQEQVALRFCSQLEQLTNPANGNISMELLQERCTKAITYFHNEIRTNILKPLQLHIAEFTGIKKARIYWKKLNELEADLVAFTTGLSHARYNDEPVFSDKVTLPPLREHEPTVEIKTESKIATGKNSRFSTPKKKTEKGETQRMTFEMFKQGKSVADIAAARNLAISTIEGHLTQFVRTGEIAVTDIVSQEKTDAISALLLPLVANAVEIHLETVRKQLGNSYSFGEIKMVLNHCLRIYEQQNQEKIEGIVP
ncbi:MAG: helix-turn-helix domain-containing protein [Prevotellaceae bacterium]|jgi:hypothetical protein|nr:helix-turn-helix domain-containing protein [Prevotellaceae bacterium]